MIGLGDRPGVGVGLILQGGLNHFMRKFGLATDNIIQVLYLDPSGELKEARSKEELFPFRGAGPNFGVVLEVTLRAFPLESIVTCDTTYFLRDYTGVATEYSRLANSFQDSASLDGFIFWSSHDQVSFATSYFKLHGDLSEEEELDATRPLLALDKGMRDIQHGEIAKALPSDLPDHEIYMTQAFAPEQTLAHNQDCPSKLRSMKRCPLLPTLLPIHETILFEAIGKAPTKWCYVHFLHGGGAVTRVSAKEAAFGNRDWKFAAVITARWSDGDTEAEKEASVWLDQTTNALIPHSVGFYGADLTPEDTHLSSSAFGQNSLRLATIKRRVDPLNIFRSVCPLRGDQEDPRTQKRGVVVILCGRRFAGKDWLADIASSTIKALVGDENFSKLVSCASISDETKRSFARAYPSIDANKLIDDRSYKEEHRKDLKGFYERECAQDPAYSAKCYVNCVEQCNDGILLVTGMRDGLKYARSLSGRPVVLVKVNSVNKSKQARGWTFDPEIDESRGECAADTVSRSFWDLVYHNDSDEAHAADWVIQSLAPAIVKRCTRYLKDTPKPGICFRDVVGSLFLQPFAMSLCTSLAVHWLVENARDSFDVIVTPEVLGYVFAGAIAGRMHKPLILVRKGDKLPGAIVEVSYEGSNMHNLQEEGFQNTPGTQDDIQANRLEMIDGSIQPGQRILVVDDCLASGSTVVAVRRLVELQGGTVTKLVCLMELPDLKARQLLTKMDILSLMQFPGK